MPILPKSVPAIFANATESLQVRDYRNFFIGQCLSFTGTWMRRIALGWIVFELTGEYEWLGLIFSLIMLPLLFFSPLAGAYADRFTKRNMILITQVVSGILSYIMAYLVFTDQITVELIIIYALLSGTAFAFEVPARQSYLKELVGREKLKNAIALNSALINLTRIAGPALAGWIMSFNEFGKTLVFLVDGTSYLVVIFTLLILENRGLPHSKSTLNSLQQVMEGFKAVLHHRVVAETLSLLFILGVCGWSFQTILPGIVQDVFGLKESYFGVLMGVFGVGATIAALTVATSSQKTNSVPSLIIGMVTMAISLILMSLWENYYWVLFMMIPAGFGAVYFLSVANTTVQTSVPDSIRGRVMGIWAVAFGGSLPLGSYIAGKTADLIGPFHTIFVLNTIMLVSLAGVIIWKKNKKLKLAKHTTHQKEKSV